MNNIELKELINAHMVGVRAELKSMGDMMNFRFDEVIKHQKETNGRVTRTEIKVDCLEKTTTIQRWIRKNPKATVAFGVLFVLIISAVGDFLGLSTIVKIFKWW